MELDRVSGAGECAVGEHECGFVAVRPTEPLGLEAKRGLVGSRSHDVAVDGLQELLDESRFHGNAVCEFVRCLEPIDASIPSRDEAIEARYHVDRHARQGS